MHPNFTSDEGCITCAAFEKWSTSEPDIEGLCHRHAPRPSMSTVTFNGEGEEVLSTTEQQHGKHVSVDWPIVRAHSQMFCCEWLPIPVKATPKAAP